MTNTTGIEIDLFDNGRGADFIAGDGIYSRYLIIKNPGRYFLTVKVSIVFLDYFKIHWYITKKYDKKNKILDVMVFNRYFTVKLIVIIQWIPLLQYKKWPYVLDFN